MEATTKQISFIAKLASERALPDSPARLVEEAKNPVGLDKRQASTLIDWLLALPRKPLEASTVSDSELGIYVLGDGTLVLHKPNRSKSGSYTMRWVDSGLRVRDERGEWDRGDWEYDPSLKRELGSARKMTAAEAKEFVVRYGKCPRCSYKLKAAQSVERGIGPVCRTYWPDWELQFQGAA